MEPKIKLHDKVLVYDRYRFGIPLRGIVNQAYGFDGEVSLELIESNNIKYPIGCSIWVHSFQLRLEKEQFDPGPGGIGVD